MKNNTLTLKRFIGFAVLLSAFFCVDSAIAQKKKELQVEDIENIVAYHFSRIKDFEQGDLITTKHVEPLFGRLAKAGWKVSGSKEILDRVVKDGSFLAKQLGSKDGKSYFNEISQTPGAIDRLDRISKLPLGQKSAQKLIQGGAGGVEFLEAMTSSRAGKLTSKRLANSRKSKDFNKPTEKIYTVDALVGELKVRFEEDQAKKAAAKKKKK